MKKLILFLTLLISLSCYSQRVATIWPQYPGSISTDSGYITVQLGWKFYKVTLPQIRAGLAGGSGAYEPIITASNTTGKYWNGYKQFVGLNTDSITEGSKKFVQSISITKTSLFSSPQTFSYNSGTGAWTSTEALASQVATSIFTNATNASTTPTWLAFSADGQLLVRRAGVLTAGTLVSGDIPDISATYAKLSVANTFTNANTINFNGTQLTLTPDGGTHLGTINVDATSKMFLTATGGISTNGNALTTGAQTIGANSSITFSNGTGNIVLPSTITAGGTTGAQTINKAKGTVNFAAAATSLVVTNSLVTTSSVVECVIRTADANNPLIRSVVCGTGSFTITLSTGPAAEISVGFIVY